MSSPRPQPPDNLHPFSRELLESLTGHSEAAEIVIGGGVALSHYLQYRDTVDLDAWWRAEPRAEALVFRLARQERDTWVTWPNRVAALMAAEVALGVEKQTRTPEISEGVEVLFGMGFEHPLQDHGLDDVVSDLGE